MKKFFILLCVVMICSGLVACSSKIILGATTPYDIVNDFEYASMKIVDVSQEDQTITVEFSYSGENELLYGQYYEIEMLQDGKWYRLAQDSNIYFTSEAYVVETGQTRQKTYGGAYDTLPAGHYRIIVEVDDFVETGVYTEYPLAAEFDVE